MEIVSPSGHTYVWNNPAHPTEDDIAALQQYHEAQYGTATTSAPADPAVAPAAAPAEEPAPAVVAPEKKSFWSSAWDALGHMGSMEAGTAAPRDEAQAKAYIQGTMNGVPTALRTVPPLLAAPLGPLGVAPAAGVGEELAQLAEGRKAADIDLGQVGKAVALGATPARAIGPAGPGVIRAGIRVAGEAGKFALMEAAGDTAKASINAGGLQLPYQNLEQTADAMKWPLLLGSVARLAGDGAEQFAAAKANRAARLQTLQDAGIDQPTLDLLFPDRAPLVNRVAQLDPAVSKLRYDAQQPLMEQFEQIAAGAPEHEEIYRQLRPYVGQLDDARAYVGQLEENAASAKQTFNDAYASSQTADPELAALREAAANTELNALRGKALMLTESDKNLGGLMNYDDTAQQFRSVVDRLFQVRKDIGAAKYAAANVPATPILPRTDLVAAAKRGLARWRGTDMEKQILATVQNAGDNGRLSLQQFRELRTGLSDRFAGLDPRQLNAYEAAAKAAYGEMSATARDALADVPGVDINAFDQAQAYWRATAEAAGSRYVKPLLAKEPSESTFQSLAADLAAGKTGEVRSFNDFVSAISQDAPEVAQLAGSQLSKAVRNSFLGQARTPTGIDTKKLTDGLLSAAPNYPVQRLGFGTVDDIRRWRSLLQEFSVKELTPAQLGDIFADPQMQRAAAVDGSVATALRPAVARQAYEQAVTRNIVSAIAGNPTKAQAAAAQAKKAAQAAEMTLNDQRAVLAGLEADPVARAFAGGQTWGIPSVPGASGRGLTKTMMTLGPSEGMQLMNALRRKSPAIAELAQRRVVADTLQFMRPANAPGATWALDKNKARKFFNPAAGSKTEQSAGTIRALVGPETFGRYEKLLKAVELVGDVERGGGIISTDGSRTVYAGTKLANDLAKASGAASSPALSAAALKQVGDWWAQGKYHALSSLVANKPFANAFWSKGGDYAAALQSLPRQQAYLLLGHDALLQNELNRDDAQQKP